LQNNMGMWHEKRDCSAAAGSFCGPSGRDIPGAPGLSAEPRVATRTLDGVAFQKSSSDVRRRRALMSLEGLSVGDAFGERFIEHRAEEVPMFWYRIGAEAVVLVDAAYISLDRGVGA
jgi:hypothetical protein